MSRLSGADLRWGSIARTLVPRGVGSRLSGDRGARFLASVVVGVVDDADEFVVEVGADGVGVGGGVVALAAQDGDELGAGLVEAAAFADGLEAAVELERSGAVAVAEQPTMEPGGVSGVMLSVVVPCGDGVGFDGAGGGEVLLGDGGVGDAGVDEGHPW